MKRLLKQLYAALPCKRPLFMLLRRLPLPERIYQHLHFTGVITVDLDVERSIRMRHHGFIVENELFWRGLDGWERNSLRLWQLLCARADHIVDIGANTGVYALIGACLRPNARIAAVGPVERVFRMLEENIALNQAPIQAVRMAITDRNGVVQLFDRPGTRHEYDATLSPDYVQEYPDAIATTVEGRTLQGLLDHLGWDRVELLKIDVEAHEAELITGALPVLRRDRPAMLIEILSPGIGDRVMAALEGMDYLCFTIDEVQWPPQRTDHLGRGRDRNHLICTPETARAIGLAP